MKAEIIRAQLADRTSRTLRHYEAMFGGLPIQPGETLVNVGAGDSALGNELPSVDVIDVDYGYHELPPLYEPDRDVQPPYRGTPIAALARDIPLADSVSQCTVASFLLMHMSTGNARRTIDEFIRITEPGHSILLGPVWDDKGVARTIADEFVTFRSARYVDGWDRFMHSLVIVVPEDKAELTQRNTSDSLARSGVLANKFWNRDNLKVLRSELMQRLLSGSNRRPDRTGKDYALEESGLMPEPTQDIPLHVLATP